ncbi:RraA family protein [Actinokineospora globicatena]|uniref:Putative 4-hydroxy-4-methyl-2-oxoglutarate aldolase n=1 Tax=Actinokineospora globicatena TaxID=103729 RepID=A0A9W6V8E6_9PSEU|nr:RraA family protein [Actinokineospora globicatena]MCP2303581.1 Regulator of RNase E activity RraA [Actinokineospora globicatena]GLW79281.1 demethylmenaquinone methyltransferase [Actinokineospora globicatena]GLW86309.1 demethylmenaquinone methyltransferase [Actinokineospora globicatena]GLW89901.1 demethylmenaquinone methyltransferase [Actinokineospora globicatena]
MSDLADRFAQLTTAHFTDACVRAGVEVRTVSLVGVHPADRVFGRVLPARHAGSVDIFLEAFESAQPGDVLVVDNGGRRDHACVGDLVVLEGKGAGIAGVVIWGLHRDTADIRVIGLPVFSLGSIPTGPLVPEVRRPDALESADVGPWTVTRDDLVLGDDDGILFIPATHAEDLFDLAESIRDTERAQADRIRAGTSLRSQVDFSRYLATDPPVSFREHLRTVGGAIEE